MKLTKFQHACFTLEKQGTTLVVDPGEFTHNFIIPKHVDGIVITHEHPDHLDTKLVERIIAANPKVTVIGHPSITTKYTNTATIPVEPGQPYVLGNFSLQFFGGTHAPIAEGIITPPNLGVLVDNALYYPGDSFTVPQTQGAQLSTLLLPISAPWLDFARTRDFLGSVMPHYVIPTHDGILSEDGKKLAEKMVGGFAQSKGITYKRLDGESVELV